jgi:hypothetical protein
MDEDEPTSEASQSLLPPHFYEPEPVPEWTLPFYNYLTTGELPEEEVHARQVKRRSSAYTIIDQELYKRSVTGVLQRCVSVEKGKPSSLIYIKACVATTPQPELSLPKHLGTVSTGSRRMTMPRRSSRPATAANTFGR